MARVGADSIAKRGRPRSAAAHAAILDAVIPMIQEVGYDAFSMEALAARSGVSKATIYRHWGSKEDLAVEAAHRFVARIATPDTGSLRGDLVAALVSDATLHSDPQTPALLASLAAAMARSPRIAEAVRGGFVFSREQALVAILTRAIARRELRANLDIPLAVQMCAGTLLYRTLIAGERSDAGLVRRLVDMLLGGLPGASRGAKR
jgi:AcrR family transcriptional regulator